MIEAAVRHHQLVQAALTGVAERRMSEIVRERDRLRELLIQTKRASNRARDLRGFERMGESGAVVVALVIYKDLGLVFEAAKRSRMNYPIAIALKDSANRMLGLGKAATAAVSRRHRIRRQCARLDALQLLPRPQHRRRYPPPVRGDCNVTTSVAASEVPRASSANSI